MAINLSRSSGVGIGINNYMPEHHTYETSVAWANRIKSLGLKFVRSNHIWPDSTRELNYVRSCYEANLSMVFDVGYEEEGVELCADVAPLWPMFLKVLNNDIHKSRRWAIWMGKALAWPSVTEWLCGIARGYSTRLAPYKSRMWMSQADDCENSIKYVGEAVSNVDPNRYRGPDLLVDWGCVEGTYRAKYEEILGKPLPTDAEIIFNTNNVEAAVARAWGGKVIPNAHHAYWEFSNHPAINGPKLDITGVGRVTDVMEFGRNRTTCPDSNLLLEGARLLKAKGAKRVCLWCAVKGDPYGGLLESSGDLAVIPQICQLFR